MAILAQFGPKEYVRRLMNLSVPGYSGSPSGVVSLRSYLCLLENFGGNHNAAALRAGLLAVLKGKPELATVQSPAYARVITGQGTMADIIDTMSIVNKYRDELKTYLKANPSKDPKANHNQAAYFDDSNFLQTMVDDHCFGLDCIGFVSTYLMEVGMFKAYPGLVPVDFALKGGFTAVSSMGQIKDLAVVMLTNGSHVQIIDKIISPADPKDRKNTITVDLCQSSSGGPQCNEGLEIRGGGREYYLPIAEFRAKRDLKTTPEYEADLKARLDAGAKPLTDAQKPGDFEAFLRRTMGEKNHSGLVQLGPAQADIFHTGAGGTPPNPVSNSVYIANATVGLSVAAPPPAATAP